MAFRAAPTAGARLTKCRGYRNIRTPIDERYEVVEPDEAHRLRNEMEKKKERVIERYNDSLDPMAKKKSFGLRSGKFMRPFTIDVFLSSKYIHCTIMHRTQHRVIAAVSSNSRDMKALLPSRCDLAACRVVGETLAERAKEADCYAVAYQPRKMEKLEGKLAAVLETVANCGISIYHTEKGLLLAKD